MKAAKPLIAVLVLVVLVVVVVAGYLLKNLDSIVKGVIEDVGTEVTGTRVTLDAVALDLSTGRGTLSGLVIANPRGFSSDYAFALDEVTIGIQTASLGKPVIVVSEAVIQGARLIAEQKGDKTNLDQILQNVKRAAARGGEKPAEAPAEEGAGVRLVLQKFVFADTQAKVVTEVKGEASLKVPDVRRSNIGDPAVGLTPTELSERLLQAVLEEVRNAVEDYLADLAKEAAKQKIKEKMGISDDKADAVEGGLRKLFKGE